jgi:phenylpropionate dioxygenase-like ring-hydroxylating dioxygenase large terminal subunit
MRREWRANWKLILDTFMESYHVFALHGASVGPDYPGHVMVFDAYGPHMRIPVPRASLLDLASRPRDEWDLLAHATVQYHLSPNAMVNHTIDHLILWRFVPTAVDATVAEMTMYVKSDEVSDDPAWRKGMDDWFDLHDAVTRDEDYPESERIQRTLGSGRVPPLVLGRNEGAVQHFHRSIRDRVAGAVRS